jgi:transcriptional regulator with XRE-family HTH domain
MTEERESRVKALALARKRQSLSQAELGQQVARMQGVELTEAAGQKKVSLWENFKARPSGEELSALSTVLRTPLEIIQSWFLTITPQCAPAIFQELAISSRPCLLVACFSGRPRAVSSTDIRGTLLSGLNNQLSIAMCIPYPANLKLADTTEWTLEDPATELFFRYQDVRSDVLQLKSSFEAGLSRTRTKNLRVYQPKLRGEGANVLIPPVASRYTLIINEVGVKSFVEELWTWVESEDIDGLFKVGGVTVEKAAPQVRAWRSYFGEIVSEWMKNEALPEKPRHWEIMK